MNLDFFIIVILVSCIAALTLSEQRNPSHIALQVFVLTCTSCGIFLIVKALYILIKTTWN